MFISKVIKICQLVQKLNDGHTRAHADINTQRQVEVDGSGSD